MLRTNIKIWAIVVAICIICQFFITSIPVWIENGKQEAQIEIDKREEERLKSHENGLEPVEVEPVATTASTEDIQTNASIIEKTDENVVENESEEESNTTVVFIVFIIVFLIVLMLVMWIV